MSEDRFLLDSHILIWMDAGDSRITPRLLETLRFTKEKYLSAATAWELGLKIAAGKLRMSATFTSLLSSFALLELPITIQHSDCAAQLPMNHGDPFDRIMIAQAMVEGLTLVTADERLLNYGVPVLFVN